MENSQLTSDAFFSNFSNNTLQWIVANRAYLGPVHWLCQRGYRVYLFGEDLFLIGTGAQVGMPPRIQLGVHRPVDSPSPLKPLTQAFKSVKPTAYGKAFYVSRGCQIHLTPIHTLYWPKEVSFFGWVDKSPCYLWRCATFSIQACVASLGVEADGVHGLWADEAESIYESTRTRTLHLQPKFDAEGCSPKYLNWVRGFALQWVEDYPDWSLGESLQKLVHGKSLLVTGMEDASPQKRTAPINML